jgi:hypothetical protein
LLLPCSWAQCAQVRLSGMCVIDKQGLCSTCRCWYMATVQCRHPCQEPR